MSRKSRRMFFKRSIEMVRSLILICFVQRNFFSRKQSNRFQRISHCLCIDINRWSSRETKLCIFIIWQRSFGNHRAQRNDRVTRQTLFDNRSEKEQSIHSNSCLWYLSHTGYRSQSKTYERWIYKWLSKKWFYSLYAFTVWENLEGFVVVL